MLLFISVKTKLTRIQFVVRATDKINDICTKSVKMILRKKIVYNVFHQNRILTVPSVCPYRSVIELLPAYKCKHKYLVSTASLFR